MIALSATGLIAGVLVSERQRFEADNRRQQQALAQVALRGGMGEFGAAIAHEVNRDYRRRVHSQVWSWKALRQKSCKIPP